MRKVLEWIVVLGGLSLAANAQTPLPKQPDPTASKVFTINLVCGYSESKEIICLCGADSAALLSRKLNAFSLLDKPTVDCWDRVQKAYHRYEESRRPASP